MHSSDICEKTASHTPVSIQEKKYSRNLIVTRACAHDSPTSTSWSGGYARRRRARGHGFEPHLLHRNFLRVTTTQSSRSWVRTPSLRKKINFFCFRVCPCLVGDPVIKLFSQLNPAHRGRVKFPGIAVPARITAYSFSGDGPCGDKT